MKQTSQLDVPKPELDQRIPLFGIARRKRLEVESIYRTLHQLENLSVTEDKRRDPPTDMVDEMRLLFDGANSNLIVPRRTGSVSPLQALFLMNNPHIKRSTEEFVKQLHQTRSTDAERIQFAFALLYGRDATKDEIEAGTAFVADWKVEKQLDNERKKSDEIPAELLSKWQAYLQVLLLSNEFIFVD